MSSAAVNAYTYSEVATFATTAPAAGATWLPLPAIGNPRIKKEQGIDEAQETNLYGARSPHYSTAKASSFGCQTRIYTGTKAFDGVGGDSDPAACFLQKAHEHYFGMAASAAFTGTTVGVASGPGNTTPLIVTSAANLAVGMGIQVGSEIRFITAISGVNITLNADLLVAANYVSTTAIYGAFNFRPTLGNFTKKLYVNHQIHGHSDMAGPMQVSSWKIGGLGAKDGLRLDLGFTGSSYAAGVTPSSQPTNAYVSPIVAVAGTILINGSARAVVTGSIDPGCKWEPVTTSSTSGAVDGVEGWEMTEVTPSAELESYYASADWTDYAASTARDIMIAHQVGSTNAAKARGSIAVWMPQGQMTVDDSQPNNQVGQKLSIKGNVPTTAQITAGLTSPVYVAIFGGI